MPTQTINDRMRRLQGRNVYLPHPLMINRGTFWRCAHGTTGRDGDGGWDGCDECLRDLKACTERDHVRVDTIVSLMGGDVDIALSRLDAAFLEWPGGEIVLTHGPFDMPVEMPEKSFQNLLAIWWQDKDDGSQYSSLIWSRS